tara:strand:- start:588 stop:1049 length:462 start_codon:yes stop_codon:yes gene_type:complete
LSVKISLIVNNQNYKLDVEPYETLNFILREKLGFTGTKQGCDTGGCGSCTVILDGKAVYSCMTFGVKVNGSNILTIEGLKKNEILDPVQKSFVDNAALQCGYCTPGFVMSVKALLDENKNPDEDTIRDYLVGNICRCTGYTKIIKAVKDLSKK